MKKKQIKNKRKNLTAKEKRVTQRNHRVGVGILFGMLILLAILKITNLLPTKEYTEVADDKITAEKPDIQVELLDVNPYSRPGTKSEQITGIVVHYTANPSSTAQQNRDYFNDLQDTHITSASSHFVIGLDGEIIQCVPTWEIAYASNDRNKDTVSIECCHPDETGELNRATYQSLVQLTAWLSEKFELEKDDIIRHYDITGKICPKYFVEHEDAWSAFKDDVQNARELSTEEISENN